MPSKCLVSRSRCTTGLKFAASHASAWGQHGLLEKGEERGSYSQLRRLQVGQSDQEQLEGAGGDGRAGQHQEERDGERDPGQEGQPEVEREPGEGDEEVRRSGAQRGLASSEASKDGEGVPQVSPVLQQGSVLTNFQGQQEGSAGVG